MRGASLPALRHAFHLDRSAAGNETTPTRGTFATNRRARRAAAKQDARSSARPCVHPQAWLSGRSGCLRGFVERRTEFPQPESVSRRFKGRGGRALYTGKQRHLCAYPDRLLSGDSLSRIVPARSFLHPAAGRLASLKNTLSTARKTAGWPAHRPSDLDSAESVHNGNGIPFVASAVKVVHGNI